MTDPDDLLLVREFVTVEQEVTCVSVTFDDAAVADYFDRQVDLGRRPEQFARIWCHTHPDMSPAPSVTDEETFNRVFGTCQWAVMFILARDNRTYARLSFHVGPGGHVLIPVGVDYRCAFTASDHEAWETEFAAHIHPAECFLTGRDDIQAAVEREGMDLAVSYDFLEEFQCLDPAERQLVLDELAGRPELWDPESEVMLL